MNTQEELPLEWPVPQDDRYTIELRKGPQFGEDEVVRTHRVRTVEDAEVMIESLRESAASRDGVQWQAEEVNAEGKMYGLAPRGVVFVISVSPSLTVPLS
jgi:hypothetical protein